MFWKFDLNTTSHVDKLLDKEQVTLHELMDEDDILQECKAQNRKLLDFLCRQQCMEELVGLITQEPPLDMDEKVRFKYPNTACELLTCDVPQISDRLGGDESLLGRLCDFLDREPPLNPLLASFFSKTIGNLVARKTEQVIAFLKKKDRFISLVLKHIGTSALMDLLLRLVSCVEPAGLRREVLHWLNEEKIIQRLVELIHPSQDEDRQSNASQTLCDMVRLGRDQALQLQEAVEPDPLLTALESQDCVEQLLRNMFDGDRTESCLVSGTQVLLTLLETRQAGTESVVEPCSQGPEGPFAVSSGILQGIEPRLRDFHQLLLSPPKKQAILTTLGVLEEPLGNARLHGARLMAVLLHTNTPSINQELCRLNTMDLLLDLFFKYTWNNFLHFQVELCIAAILAHAAPGDRGEAGGAAKEAELPQEHDSGQRDLEPPQPMPSLPANSMVTHLFQKCCLVQRILEAWEANDHTQAAGGLRRGHMGHLTRIANAVAQTHVSEVIPGLPAECRGRWESFVGETLTETNRRNTVDLAFSEYQMQQMTANFADQFGFKDEDFADQDDGISAPFDRIAEIDFSIDAEEDSPSAALFEACCSDRIQPFDDEEDDDIWENEETRCPTRVMARARFGTPHTAGSCSKKPPERGGQERRADAEEADGDAPGTPVEDKAAPLQRATEGAAWVAVFDEPGSLPPGAASVARDVGSSVWVASASAPEEKGWAQFADFQPFCCSESGPRCSSPVDTEGSRSQGQEPAFSTASPCAWNMCVTSKTSLVASRGSSSEEDKQKAAGTMDTRSMGPDQETSPLPSTETAAGGRVACVGDKSPEATGPAPVETTKVLAVATGAPHTLKAEPPTAAPAVFDAAAVAAPNTGTVAKDRETDTPPEGAAFNRPGHGQPCSG
ncbi:serine/threonine-protein phosphatase 6 regulatory subunit 2 isoform X2 [Ochotona curzoniae]|uniref:serine/threonine-protein phosphatase 6 regulatory subunit 2 isoform X2 n=1 Tax=Ochotona curzoniae TaxID=130825 RepID=UPI001B35049D|nr:serine/threonine-protein phosphatase 6 regulatory subunit 2 isoform X2 [Ochotona curzoniae]